MESENTSNQDNLRKTKFIPKPKLKRIPPTHVDFEEYITESCENKIKIFDRETFAQIQRPIVIIFNHFREKCNHHIKWLDKLYQSSLKYGDHIEFIVADIMDIDILYPGQNPLRFCSKTIRPENQTPHVYAMDEKKRTYEYFNYNKVETFDQLCEDLLNAKLYLSQPLNEAKESNVIKISVLENFEELVVESNKNVYLIVNDEAISDGLDELEPYYADFDIEDLNVDIVYIEADKNYIPFEYSIDFYPTMLFIPSNDKNNFVFYDGSDSESEFLRKLVKQPEHLKKLQLEQQSYKQCKSAVVAADFKLPFKKLPNFLREHYKDSLAMLDREVIEKSKSLIFIAFMDFQGKILAKHVEYFNKFNQLAEMCFFKFFIADFNDIDVINSKWQTEDLIQFAQDQPKIYAIDRLNHTYEFGNFNSLSSLYYFADSIENGDFYYSQVYNESLEGELVQEWTADAFYSLLNNSKNYIFITFYSSENGELTEKLVKLLPEIAKDVKDLNVEVVKFDVKLNYVDLEYAQSSYPAHYFIDKHNKKDNKLYVHDSNKDNILEFIKMNVKEKDDNY